MKKFTNKNELINAHAEKAHLANLSVGGVFNADGSRFSDLATEVEVSSGMVKWDSRVVNKAVNGFDGEFYIKGFGECQVSLPPGLYCYWFL